ncbi:MAG: flavin reductase (DIM6/NTAB) family NADH-FMN oxidoreductase RutF [Candidatus Endobugula sp.]|jgi:flavin reductase (DIM6/NTAB) family NADH-FMN oxidoreductase RutF
MQNPLEIFMTDITNNIPELKESLRLGMRRLAAGVCVISTQVGGQRYAMTASSVTSVSDEPASLLVCVNQEASMYSLLAMGQPFVINVLSQAQQSVSNICAARDTGEERFSCGDWQNDDNGMPYLADAQVNFFCRVDNDDYRYGTHQIVIGCLEKAIVSDDAVNPLVYVNGAYAAVTG